MNCSQACECFNGANCDHATGEILNCKKFMYNILTPVLGDCLCESGFFGDKCLDKCPYNKFGLNCTETCSCKNGATCDKDTGNCHCTPGWDGVDCSKRLCQENKYGLDCNQTCECESVNTEFCQPHNGKCYCKAGWSGVTCNQTCPALKYGKSCALRCDCHNNAQCSPIDGTCICPAGII